LSLAVGVEVMVAGANSEVIVAVEVAVEVKLKSMKRRLLIMLVSVLGSVVLNNHTTAKTVWPRWSDLLVAGMWILCEELCSSRTHVT
jgi:hypothetical protein